MSQLLFAYVNQSGFAAFQTNSAPWTLVDSSAYDDASKPLWNAPVLVFVKVRIQRTILGLVVAMHGAGDAKGCDRVWDSCEKQLNGLLGVHVQSNDPAKRDAAKRLQNKLLQGAGVAQTLLRYQEEVDFGRKQIAMVSTGQGADDVALLELGPMMNEIALATESLAAAIGHGETVAPPYARRAKAVAACVAAFDHAAESLEWLIAHGGNGSERDIAIELYASLEDLAQRYLAPLRTNPSAAHAKEASPPSVH